MENVLAKIKGVFGGGQHQIDPLAVELGLLDTEPRASEIGESSNSMLQVLVGSMGAVADFYFPPDLIGGCCPRVAGDEQDIIWNAAAEACDTERVHVVWQAKDEKIYYLAVGSEGMASHPNTWCPFASLLPGMPDSAVPPTIYTYFSDETATMMTVTADILNIHRGTVSVVRAKAERMARELNNAPIIELVPDHIRRLAPVPWYSLSLFEEKSRRILATFAVFSSILFAGIGVIVWFVAAMSAVSSHADLEEIKKRSEEKSLELMRSVQEQRTSPMREQLAKFADLNDGLLALNGFLEVYQIQKNKVEWRAVVPSNVTSDRIRELGGQTLDNNELGVVIGSSRDALNLGAAKERRKK